MTGWVAGWAREDLFLSKNLYTKHIISVNLLGCSGGYQVAYFSFRQLPVVTVVWMMDQVCYLDLAVPHCNIVDQHNVHLK